ncbi:MAG: hypothetical protein U0746_12965 [Gemmataceae bacterium]
MRLHLDESNIRNPMYDAELINEGHERKPKDQRLHVVRDTLILRLAIGLWLPIEGSLGWLRSAVGGTVAFAAFAVCGHAISRLLGRPLGWIVGGMVGLSPAAALWMYLIGSPDSACACAVIGAITGWFGGAVGGGLLGGISLVRDFQTGRCKGPIEAIGMTFLMLGAFAFVGFLVLTTVVKAKYAM